MISGKVNKASDSSFLIYKFILGLIKFYTRNMAIADAIIKNVDETNYTVDVTLTGGSDINDIPIKAVKTEKASLIEIPKIGTECLIGWRNNMRNLPQLINVHECDKILITVGESTLDITDGLFSFNGGELGGMVKLSSLLNKLNAIENDLNTIKNVFTVWVPVPSDGGAALKTAATSWAAQTLVNTQASDIENTKIKQ